MSPRAFWLKLVIPLLTLAAVAFAWGFAHHAPI